MTRISRIAIAIIASAITSSSACAQAHDYQLETLPKEVAAQVEQLMLYGDRYDAVIRQIIAQADRPLWGWDTCEDTGSLSIAELPES